MSSPHSSARVVLITGAAGGVGSVLVDRFLANGDTVIATDTRPEVLDTWRERWAVDARLFTVAADIASEPDTTRLAEFARDTADHVDVLVNCAGFFPIIPFEEMTAADWTKVVDINLTGTFLVTRAILPLMKDRGWGRMSTSAPDRCSTAPPDRRTTWPPRQAWWGCPGRWPARSAPTASPSTS